MKIAIVLPKQGSFVPRTITQGKLLFQRSTGIAPDLDGLHVLGGRAYSVDEIAKVADSVFQGHAAFPRHLRPTIRVVAGDGEVIEPTLVPLSDDEILAKAEAILNQRINGGDQQPEGDGQPPEGGDPPQEEEAPEGAAESQESPPEPEPAEAPPAKKRAGRPRKSEG